MIQRIQTLLLLSACGLLVSLFFVPLGTDVPSAAGVPYSDSTVLSVLLGVSALVAGGGVFLYRRRMVQIRLCVFNTVVLLGTQGLLVYYFFAWKDTVAFSLTAVFPAIAAILTALALRYIARDEAMVRTANRLRK